MSTFSVKIIKNLNEYKKILRAFLVLKEANARIHRLGLANKKMLCVKDVTLYKIANKTLDDLQIFIKGFDDSSQWRSRLQEFYECLQKDIQEFRVDGEKIINVQQEVSRLSLEIIQLLNSFSEKNDADIMQKIQTAMEKIQEYGAQEQYLKLKDMVEKKTTV